MSNSNRKGVVNKFPNTPQGVRMAHRVAGEFWEEHVDWWGEENRQIDPNNECLALQALVEVATEDPALLSPEDLLRAKEKLRALAGVASNGVEHGTVEAIGQTIATREILVVPYAGTEAPITVTVSEPHPLWVQMPA